MASFTVSFDDGSSHTYDNVPEGVTSDEVKSRAAGEFGDKKVTNVGGGEASPNPVAGMGTRNPNTTVGQDIIAGGTTAVNMANEFLGSPVGHAAEAYVGYKNVAKPLIDKYLQTRAGLPTATQAVGSAPKAPFGFTPPSGPVASAGAMPTSAPAMGAATPAQPPAGGLAAEQGSTFLQRLGQQFGQMRQAVAPVIEQAATRAAPYARGAGGVAAAVMPGNVGQNYGAHFPQAGPMRGMEINPQTGRPWSPQELAQYAQLNQ